MTNSSKRRRTYRVLPPRRKDRRTNGDCGIIRRLYPPRIPAGTMLILELSQTGRSAAARITADRAIPNDLPEQFRRNTLIGLPDASEPQALRDFTNLSCKNFLVWQAAGGEPAQAAAA
jgi:hypothetical protein